MQNPNLAATTTTTNPSSQTDPYRCAPITHYATPYPHLHQQPPSHPNPVHEQTYQHHVIEGLYPPGVGVGFGPPAAAAAADPFRVTVNSYAVTYNSYPGHEQHQQQGVAYDGVDSSLAAYYQNPYVSGVPAVPNSVENTVPATATSTFLANPTVMPRNSVSQKKSLCKTKIVQSAWCEVCKVDCNSKDVLDQHRMGKKHKKNLDRLKGATSSASLHAPTPSPAPVPILARVPASTSASGSTSATSVVLNGPVIGPQPKPAIPNNPVIGPQENPANTSSSSDKRKRRKLAESLDWNTKRKKVLEGGAAADAVRICAVCNVVCNSETVFKYHLLGQKHASSLKKLASQTGIAASN